MPFREKMQNKRETDYFLSLFAGICQNAGSIVPLYLSAMN